MRNCLVVLAAAALLVCAGTGRAQQCDVFTDVAVADSFCPAVQWLKNRNITTGCTTTTYCPGTDVNRAQMALFMNRLGKALSPEILYTFGRPMGFTVLSVAPFGVHCVTTDSTSTMPPLNHPTTAVITTTFTGLADNTIAWRSVVVYSTDLGVTWTQVPTSNAHRASSGAGGWSEVTNVAVMDLAPGLPYRFSIVVARDDLTTVGNFTDSRCQVVATIQNENGAAPPY